MPVDQQSDAKTSGEREKQFTLRQRIALWFIALAGRIAIVLICSTLRYTVTSEDEVAVPEKLPEHPMIAPFWHSAVIPATYFFRDRGCAVMTSQSFDGEYIARIIEAFGFVAVRGSSSRGAVRALLGMNRVLEKGGVAAFTIDGPRGPKYLAKPGPVLLARHSGVAIRCSYAAAKHRWVLKSWDGMQIPKPFSSVHVRWSAKMFVPRDADDAEMERRHAEMQKTLERVTEYAENAVRPRAS